MDHDVPMSNPFPLSPTVRFHGSGRGFRLPRWGSRGWMGFRGEDRDAWDGAPGMDDNWCVSCQEAADEGRRSAVLKPLLGGGVEMVLLSGLDRDDGGWARILHHPSRAVGFSFVSICYDLELYGDKTRLQSHFSIYLMCNVV